VTLRLSRWGRKRRPIFARAGVGRLADFDRAEFGRVNTRRSINVHPSQRDAPHTVAASQIAGTLLLIILILYFTYTFI
jgi:hypothetical protein